MKRIIVAGSINMDIVGKVKKHPQPGETVFSKDFQFIPGGKGANQAVAANRLGGDVFLFGKVGNDLFGKEILKSFKREGINLKNLLISKNYPTGIAMVVVNDEAENIIVVSSGGNRQIFPKEIKTIKLKSSDIILATLEIPYPAIETLFRQAKSRKATTILNAAPAVNIPNKIIRLSDYFIVNESELKFYAKTKNMPSTLNGIIRVADKIKAKGKVIIVTLGKKGLVAVTDQGTIKISGHKVKAVDATAAGDCFVGALATALSENQKLKVALKFANAAAAISTLKYGASSSLPKRKTVQAFLKNSKK